MKQLSCIFCKIVAGTIPCYTIYEDKHFLAFLDIFPLTEGHTLLVPKKHEHRVWDVENYTEYFEVCRKLVQHFRKVTKKELVMSMVLGQGVAHAHIRIIPTLNDNDPEQVFGALEEVMRPQLTDDEAKKLVKKLALI